MKIDDVNLDEIDSINKLTDALTKLRETRMEIEAKGGIVDSIDAQELQNQTNEVNRYAEAVKSLISNYEKFNGENSIDLKSQFIAGRDTKKQLEAAVQAYHNGKAQVKEYNAETRELTYVVKTGTHEFTTYTAGVSEVGNALRSVQGTTKRTETFFEAMSRKFRELFHYFSASSIVYKAFAEIKKGITYVREIDSALTELKKVTDETDETYERFLKTASKTANKVGSTIKDVVSSTADWARIGYSLEEAAKLAESTSILLNVSEFSSIEDATSALTSTLQAFGYTAAQSMDVVDVLNEVKFLASIYSDIYDKDGYIGKTLGTDNSEERF